MTPTPIWEMAGMIRAEYACLPWEMKRSLIIRHHGIPIMDESHRLYEIRRERKANGKWNSRFGLLLEIYEKPDY
jgi:hypothetical protein